MQIILLTGKQGTLKTSLWGAALERHFQHENKSVLRLDYDGQTTADFVELITSEPDVVIVETDYPSLPFAGFSPDYVLHVEAFADGRPTDKAA